MTKPKSELQRASEAVAETALDLSYLPSMEMRQLKARYWEAWAEAPTAEADKITPAAVVAETGEARFHRWWKIPLFREWFLNKESFIHKTIANGERGLDIITEIMDDENASQALRLKAALASIDALVKLKSARATQKFADKMIGEASSEDLDRMIKAVEAS